MQTVSLHEAENQLLELIQAANSGEEVIIKADDELSVQLVPRTSPKRKRQFGSARGLISMAPNFDEPLDDFREYME
jgi:antitoxin (DNA-binding transcriptional repressor) of toxin-antitoxin stability system